MIGEARANAATFTVRIGVTAIATRVMRPYIGTLSHEVAGARVRRDRRDHRRHPLVRLGMDRSYRRREGRELIIPIFLYL